MTDTTDHQDGKADTEGVQTSEANHPPMRPADRQYFNRLNADVTEAMAVAERAREQGKDPETAVEIAVATDMADRVEKLLGIPGTAERIRNLETEIDREEIALKLAKDFADGRVGHYESKAGKIEAAVRTAIALLTDGVLAAPIEGFDRVELVENDDGTEFVTVYYTDAIRSASSTAQALSVLVADYTRSILGLAEYVPRDDEIERYVEEINRFDRETGLQYSPTDSEIRFIASNLPIRLDGEATGNDEVSNDRDLDNIDTNATRDGMCLVAAEGIALKAPKIQRYAGQLEGVAWSWLETLLDGEIGNDDAIREGDSDGADDTTDITNDADSDDVDPPRIDANERYLEDQRDGQPVLGHPSKAGGFRLRYGRARNLGVATVGVHPATMHIIDDFLATGTQIKTERPGRVAKIVPVDSIEGPIVRLASGEVRQIDDPTEAQQLCNSVEKILDLGEYLVTYGEFVENNRPLAPAAYAPEWWIQEFEAAGADVQALKNDPDIDLQNPSATEVLEWATEYDCPLHPAYTYLWHDISVKEFVELADAVTNAPVESGDTVASDTTIGENADDGDGVLVIDRTESVRQTLESLLVSHHQTETTLEVTDWRPLVRSLGLADDCTRTWDQLSTEASEFDDGDNAIKAASEVAPFELRERAPTRIGAQLDRPERRNPSQSVHTLFPVTEAGGKERDVAKAAETSEQGQCAIHDIVVNQRQCRDCGGMTFHLQCPDCGGHTERYYECEDCEVICNPDEFGRVRCPRCSQQVSAATWTTVNLQTEYRDALNAIGEHQDTVGMVKGLPELTSADKTPESMEKGILRAKHGVSAFKDGTIRYDMNELPLTAVKPEELDVTADHFRELGYDTDINGDPLRHDDQLVELKVQDLVLPEEAAGHMRRTAAFVDDLLKRFYGLPAFYNIEECEELVGELVLGMAPHTSAAVVGRVIGFTEGASGYSHPFFLAAKHRDIEYSEGSVMLLMDALLNCSQQFLSAKLGGYRDVPLVISFRINPTDLDDKVHTMDTVTTYPREFYEATREMAGSWNADIQTVQDTLEIANQYHGFEYSHSTTSIHDGPNYSASRVPGSMKDKMDTKQELARKLRAVDETYITE